MSRAVSAFVPRAASADTLCRRCEGEGLVTTPYEHYDLSLGGWLCDWLEDPCPDCLGQGVLRHELEPHLERAA